MNVQDAMTQTLAGLSTFDDIVRFILVARAQVIGERILRYGTPSVNPSQKMCGHTKAPPFVNTDTSTC